MGFDKGGRGSRRGGGPDKRDRGYDSDFGGGGGGGFDPFEPRGGGRGGFGGPPRGGGYGGGGGDRFGGGGGGFGAPRSGGFGGAPRGGGGGGFSPGVAVGEGTGTVKFFNAAKGFGFVVRDDGAEDVFVHISAVEQIGLRELAEGQKLKFTLTDRNGRISATDLAIDGEIVEPKPRGAGGFGGPREGGGGGGGDRFERAPSDGTRYEGTVKFFNGQKGFGFIQRDDGQPDAFVHISAVERSGMRDLGDGQRVSFELEQDRRGKMAATSLQSI